MAKSPAIDFKTTYNPITDDSQTVSFTITGSEVHDKKRMFNVAFGLSD